jgi:hypothetical protein
MTNVECLGNPLPSTRLMKPTGKQCLMEIRLTVHVWSLVPRGTLTGDFIPQRRAAVAITAATPRGAVAKPTPLRAASRIKPRGRARPPGPLGAPDDRPLNCRPKTVKTARRLYEPCRFLGVPSREPRRPRSLPGHPFLPQSLCSTWNVSKILSGCKSAPIDGIPTPGGAEGRKLCIQARDN